AGGVGAGAGRGRATVAARAAPRGDGVEGLRKENHRHKNTLGAGAALDERRRARRRAELRSLLVEELAGQVMARVDADAELARTLDAVLTGALDPYSAVARIVSTTVARS